MTKIFAQGSDVDRHHIDADPDFRVDAGSTTPLKVTKV
jgi:hypothetical protein